MPTMYDEDMRYALEDAEGLALAGERIYSGGKYVIGRVIDGVTNAGYRFAENRFWGEIENRMYDTFKTRSRSGAGGGTKRKPPNIVTPSKPPKGSRSNDTGDSTSDNMSVPMEVQAPKKGVDIGGPLSKPNWYRIVGDGELVKRDGILRLTPLRGKGFSRGEWLRSKRDYSPLTLVLGDLLSTGAAAVTPPTWFEKKDDWKQYNLQDPATNLHWYSNVTTVGKHLATPYSATTVTATGSDCYSDICIPIFPCIKYGEVDVGGAGGADHPVGLLDIFGEFWNSSGAQTSGYLYDTTLAEAGANPFELQQAFSRGSGAGTAAEPSSDFGPRFTTTSESGKTHEAFVMGQVEIVINNIEGQTQTFEIYDCRPRGNQFTTPLQDLVTCAYSRQEDHDVWNADVYSGLRVGSSPLRYKGMRDRWIMRRRIVKVTSSSSLKVVCTLPLSKLSLTELLGHRMGVTGDVSIPGLSQFVWIRAHGIHGFDVNLGMMGNNGSRYSIQMFQRLKLWYCKPKISKYIDLRYFGSTPIAGTKLDADENLAKDDATAAPNA